MMQKLKLNTEHTPEMWNQYQFCLAIQHGNNKLLQECLKKGADPYKIWYNQVNALTNACFLENVDAVRILLENKTDPNRIATCYGRTHLKFNPLEAIVENGNTQILALLLQAD